MGFAGKRVENGLVTFGLARDGLVDKWGQMKGLNRILRRAVEESDFSSTG